MHITLAFVGGHENPTVCKPAHFLRHVEATVSHRRICGGHAEESSGVGEQLLYWKCGLHFKKNAACTYLIK